MAELTTEQAALLRDLLELARDAHDHVDLEDPADYWYRLGQRNANLHAAALTACRGDDRSVIAVTDRLTEALSRTGQTVEDLISVATAAVPAEHDRNTLVALEWVGPKAFHAAHGDPTTIDIPYGSTWGDRRDTSLTFRRRPGEHSGLLFARDSTWDEYAVLAADVPELDVEAACTVAYRTAEPVTVEHFAALVRAHRHSATREVAVAGPEVSC